MYLENFEFTRNSFSSLRVYFRPGWSGGLVGKECEFRFKRQAVVQENAHAPGPAEISLRDICSTDGQHGENRGIAPAFHQQGGNPFRMNFVGISHEVRRRRGG